ncbi:hypothetical protein N7470_004587 [Penicillium chermesinum]|nr:hypothetical protein N7470_004587 [Penicillium chermesinum]
MAEVTNTGEKSAEFSAEIAQHDSHGEIARPAGWMYKSFGIGKHRMWYASPAFQLGLVAFVCFMCPGMFNALSGLGGGGLKDPHVADQMNIALYSTFAVVGIFAGTIVNRIGSSRAGPFQYDPGIHGFNVFAGAWLGLTAGCLWTGQGAIMMSYPLEARKGHYFMWFWAIFNIGACIGALIPLGQNIHHTTAGNVNDGTYIAFIVLMFFGAILGLFVCDADKIIRPDGSRVIVMKNPSWKTELIGLYQTIRTEPMVILLFPMFWSSNWFYTYQQNAVNAAYFNVRTRALNNFLYWFAQIVAAVIIGPLLDIERVRRSIRAKIAFVVLTSLTLVIWGGGYAWQKRYDRQDVGKGSDFVAWDWTHSGYAGPMFLYFFYGLYDAVWQGIVYWIMGALGNSGRKLANLAGLYKGFQAAGSAVSWSLDDHNVSYMTIFASNWGLLMASLLCAFPLIWFRIKDSVPIEEDLKGTDETIEDVFVPGALETKRVGPEAI